MMLVIFLILTFATSLTLRMPVNVIVHSHYPGIELASLACFCDGRTYDEYSVERDDDCAATKIGFRFNLNQDKCEGALMYEVQRNENTKSDYQPNTDTISTETVEDTSKIMRLLVTWKIMNTWKCSVYVVLVEHDNELILDEDKLTRLYNKINDIPSEIYTSFLKYDGITKSTWLIYDNAVLDAEYRAVLGKGIELEVLISKGVKDKDVEPALWVDSKR
jgi:hypothetical protein